MNSKTCLAGIIFFFFLSRTGFTQSSPESYQTYRLAGFGNPIDTPFVLAGTFGEIRNDHFHTGLDFSTRNEQGKPVYAAADGHVSRIKISSGGFGKAVYITHPNGYVTVYAHLREFSEEIRKLARKIQYKKESFEMDEPVEPGTIRVKKGERIAWSGKSGSSTGPHLHFEIRDEKTEEPINPLLFGYAVHDTVKPLIKSVRFSPVASQGVVGNSDLPVTFQVEQAPEGLRLSADEYVQVFGKIGFEFEVSDFHNNSSSSLGIYSMQLTVDTQQIFSLKYDRLNFSDTRYVNAHIDYAAKIDEEGIFERCFRLPGDKLKIYEDTSSNGYFEFLSDGVHDVAVTVKDFAGNTSTLGFQLLSYSSLANAKYRQPPENYFAMLPDKGLAIHKSDVEIVIPANSIYETYLFTSTQSPRKPGFYSSTFEIGDPHVPLHKAITVSLKPKNLPDELRPKAVLVSFNKKGMPVYEGNEWNKEFVTARTKRFGSFAIAVDTLAPLISLLSLPSDTNADGPALRIKISDNLSGIKTYRTMLDGKWFLMEYDAKNNLLISEMEAVKPGKVHHLEVTVTDPAGNTSRLQKDFTYQIF